jgi:demethylmenaquinone methyltransferase / 2-methoxy-6-polyprenyl-1,4-benzoquinol methylase
MNAENPNCEQPTPRPRLFTPESKPAYVQRMFASIAQRYDLMNRLMTLGMDGLWRRKAVRLAEPTRIAIGLDLCAGTGDLAFEMVRAARGRVVAIDYCKPMVEIGVEKACRKGLSGEVTFVVGDAQRMPLAAGSVDAVTMGFGLRNVGSIDATFAEVHRVLSDGGRFACLETVLPTREPVRWLHSLYFGRVMPLLGRIISSDGTAYSYLSDSVNHLPNSAALCRKLHEAGFATVERHSLAGGGVVIYLATKGTLRNASTPQ